MLELEHLERLVRLGAAATERGEEVLVFLRVVKAVREALDVVEDHGEQLVVRLEPAVASLAGQAAEALGDGRQRSVLFSDDRRRNGHGSPPQVITAAVFRKG
jgi:hypothetical protein